MINIKKHIDSRVKDPVYAFLSKVFDEKRSQPIIDQLLDQSCIMNHLEIYYDNNEQIVGLNSFRTFKITIEGQTYYISRALSNIDKDYRGKKTTAIFVFSSMLRVKLKTLFSKHKHYFFFIASGVGNFYSSYKHISQKFLYPSLDLSNHNPEYVQLVYKLAHYFDYEVTNTNPIIVKDPYATPGRLDLNFDNRSAKELKILEFYKTHSSCDDTSLISMILINWQMIFKSLFKYCKIKISL
ncbi:hypothetical protein L3V86_00990 [Thiotrichales bacterium 19S11-10]|nr:hypothetical protein [Thiotrichales bacterium 19S11-10]